MQHNDSSVLWITTYVLELFPIFHWDQWNSLSSLTFIWGAKAFRGEIRKGCVSPSGRLRQHLPRTTDGCYHNPRQVFLEQHCPFQPGLRLGSYQVTEKSKLWRSLPIICLLIDNLTLGHLMTPGSWLFSNMCNDNSCYFIFHMLFAACAAAETIKCIWDTCSYSKYKLFLSELHPWIAVLDPSVVERSLLHFFKKKNKTGG